MKDKYFSYHWDEGFETWPTEEEAREHAQSMLDTDLEMQEGVDEEFENIYWGKIEQRAVIEPTGDKVEFEGEMVDAVKVELKAV